MPATAHRSRFARITLICIVGLTTALIATGCGEDRGHLLPPKNAQEMTDSVNKVRELVAAGDCFGALDETSRLQNQIELLPHTVDAELKKSLLDGLVTLTEVQKQCEPDEAAGATGDTGTTETDLEPTPTGETGVSGPTGETGTTGGGKPSGTTGKGNKQDNAKPPKPETKPEPKPNPTPPPVTPPPTEPPVDPGNGSGGITPNP